ncbi:MAG: response regulator [Turicibacter sp.]|nr:response regulator [Turicibacter sp.]
MNAWGVLDGNAAFAELEKKSFDLILLDVMLPGMDGFEIMENIRNQASIIFLTARGSVQDKIRGLNLGADDYMVKPFDMMELQARVESVLRFRGRESGS